MFEGVKKYINIEKGILGALVVGGIVFFVNSEAGILSATTAALKQGVYTFLFGGMLVALCENLSVRWMNKWLSVLFSTLIVSVITITVVFLIHSLKGTPKPIASTLVTVYIAPPGFFFIAFTKRFLNKKAASDRETRL